jgi:hypothetical protein
LIGKVDFVVTDAPILFNIVYLNDCPEKTQHMKDLLVMFHEYDNFNFFVNRDEENFEEVGRIQNLEESRQKDMEILAMLKRNNLYFGRYTHQNLEYIVNNAIVTHNRHQTKC